MSEMTKACTQAQLKDCNIYFLDAVAPQRDRVGTVCSDYFDNSEDAIAALKIVLCTGAGFDEIQTEMICAEMVQTGEVTTVTKSGWDRFLEVLGL